MPYLHASDHIVTVGAVNMMLFIGNYFDETHWKNLIHSCIFCLWQDRRCFGPNLFPLFRKCLSLMINYRAGGIECAVWLRFLMRDYSLSIFFLFRPGTPWCCLSRKPHFLDRNTHNYRVWMSQTIHVLSSARKYYPDNLRNKRGLSWLSGYEVWRICNMVWIKSNSTSLARSTQVGSSMVRAMIS